MERQWLSRGMCMYAYLGNQVHRHADNWYLMSLSLRLVKYRSHEEPFSIQYIYPPLRSTSTAMSLRRKSVNANSAASTMTGDTKSSPQHEVFTHQLDQQKTWFRSPRLLHWHEVPPWQQDNEYILSSYRPTSGSIWKSLASLLYAHNQSINIYTHLVGCVFFLSLPFYFYEHVYKHQPNARIMDVWVVTIYTTGVAVCFSCSAMWVIRSIDILVFSRSISENFNICISEVYYT